MYGSIEAGGTKFVCAIGDEEMTIKERVSFPTTTPEETMALVIDFFKKYEDQLVGIGIGSMLQLMGNMFSVKEKDYPV